MKLMGWILAPGGLAIVVAEYLQGNGVSLVGAGIAAVGAVVAYAADEDDQARTTGEER